MADATKQQQPQAQTGTAAVGSWGQPQQQQQAPAGNTQQLQLPPGWQIAYTPDHQVYFVDHNTRTTHWQLPAQYQQQTQQPQQQWGGGGGGFRGGRGGGGGFRGGRGGAADGGAGGINSPIGRVGIDSTKRKTKMCMNFENGSCAWGDRCAFAHGAHELVNTNNQQPQGQAQ